VEARKADPKVSQQELHLWIDMARAVSATLGLEDISAQAWERALALDAQRKARG
jgi:hypothetical protein